MKKVAGLLVVVGLLALAIATPIEASGETSRRYVGGGAIFGERYDCQPFTSFDWLAACNLPCGNDRVCEITVRDDVNGSSVHFVVCVHGEKFCRPVVYINGQGTISNVDMIDVVPGLSRATTGIVTVR